MAERGKALIILPTYNEVENIAAVIAGIRRATQQTGPFDILVVDDGSPDGTAAAVRDLQAEDSPLHLLDRGAELGRGPAYRAGDKVPKEARKWLQTERADVVIGSRYIPGGGIVNWPWHRRQLSATANFLARVILRLGVRDCTSGFRCYRVETLGRVRLDRIRSSGYSYLTELLFRCQEAGARIREVPIKFVDRQRGKSKISKTEIWKAMLTLLRLRWVTPGERFSSSSTRPAAAHCPTRPISATRGRTRWGTSRRAWASICQIWRRWDWETSSRCRPCRPQRRPRPPSAGARRSPRARTPRPGTGRSRG